MPVVPFREGMAPAALPQMRPPSPTFLMMAAAQMHSEGRLVQSQYGEPDTVRDTKVTKPAPPEEYTPSNGIQTNPSMMT